MRAAIWMMCPYRPQNNYLASDDKSGSRVTGNHFCLYFFLVSFSPICTCLTIFFQETS